MVIEEWKVTDMDQYDSEKRIVNTSTKKVVFSSLQLVKLLLVLLEMEREQMGERGVGMGEEDFKQKANTSL